MKHSLNGIIIFLTIFCKLDASAQIPGSALALMQKAIQVSYRNLPDSALYYIAEAQKIYPGYPGFYYHRSMFYRSKQEPTVALSEINDAIKYWDAKFRGPYDYQKIEYYYYHRAMIYFDSKNL